MSDLARLRRGLGALYILYGALHWALMAFAVLVSSHALDLHITGRQWSQLYFSHYILFASGGPLYLLVSFHRSGFFEPLAVVDFLVGFPVFTILVQALFARLAGGGAPALAFIPGAFLIAYGLGLRQGRAVGFGRKC